MLWGATNSWVDTFFRICVLTSSSVILYLLLLFLLLLLLDKGMLKT